MNEQEAVERGAESISDLLTMLGVNPDEGAEHDEGSRLGTSSDTIAQTIARAVLNASNSAVHE